MFRFIPREIFAQFRPPPPLFFKYTNSRNILSSQISLLGKRRRCAFILKKSRVDEIYSFLRNEVEGEGNEIRVNDFFLCIQIVHDS